MSEEIRRIKKLPKMEQSCIWLARNIVNLKVSHFEYCVRPMYDHRIPNGRVMRIRIDLAYENECNEHIHGTIPKRKSKRK